MTKLVDMIVDADHGRVFVTGGAGTSDVFIADLEGNFTGTLPNVPGAHGLEIVGTTLYVAASGAARLDRFDLTQDPPAALTSLPTAPLTVPRDLLHAGGRLWFSSRCNQWDGHIGSMNLDGSDVKEFVPPEFASWTYCPRLDGGPAAPNILFAWPYGISPVTLYEYDVSTDPPTLVKSQWDFGGYDIHPLPGGTTFAMSAGQGIGEYNLSDFSGPVFTYVADEWLYGGVDVTDARGGLLAGSAGTLYAKDVFVYELGNASAIKVFDFPDTQEYTVWDRGVVFTPGGKLLVATGYYSDDVVLHSLDPNAIDTTVSLAASRSQVSYKGKVDVTADLEPAAPGAEVQVYMKPHGRPRVLAASGVVDAAGEFRFTSTQLTRDTHFQAEFEGFGDYQASTSEEIEIRVAVVATASLLRFYGTSGKYKLYHRGDPIAVKGKVVPNHSGQQLWFYLYRFRGGSWRYEAAEDFKLRSNSQRIAFVVNAPMGTYRTRVRFNGHADHADDWSPYRYFKITS